MEYSEVNRLSRLTAILVQFQTKRIVTATELSQKFQVSKRTIYRDVKALEKAGIPILTEEGKGYTLTNYNLVKIEYINKENRESNRIIEPFAILNSENWYLVAWCRLRNEFRFFRPDRIQKMEILPENFEPHNMTLQEYFDKYH